MNWGRVFRILLIAAIPAAFIIGPLLQMKWFSGDLPFSPYYSAPQNPADLHVSRVDGAAQDYLLNWPAGRHEKPPALALRIAALDWFTVYAGDRPLQIQEEGGSPKQIALTLLFPSASSPAQGSACRSSAQASEVLFSGCQGAMAQLRMARHDSDWKTGFILRGEESLPNEEHLPYAQRSHRGLLSFWIKQDGDIQKFAGWDCSATDASTRTALLRFFAFPEPGAALCFQLKSKWERWRPHWFGYEKQPLYLECQSHDQCSAWFFFHQRIVEVRYEYLAPRDAPEARTALILSSWKYLEKAHQAAAQTQAGTSIDMPEAQAQLASCQTLAQEAANWAAQMPASEETRDEYLRRDNAGFYLKASCRRAADSALLLAPTQPAAALPLLRGIIPALQQSAMVQGSNRELLGKLQVTSVEALAASGQGESADMLNAQLQALEQANAVGGISDERVHILLQGALTLAHQQGNAVAADTRRRLFRLVERYYGSPNDAERWRQAYSGLIADMAAAQGQHSPDLLEPLRNLGWKNWRDSDFSQLKNTADQLSTVILAQALPGAGSALDSEALRKQEGAAFDAVFFYRNYGFHEKRLSEAGSLMAPLLARLDKSLGPEASFTKAARFHQQEVLSGRAQDGYPVGGGFLGY